MLVLIAAGTGTALATGLGAIPVFFLGERAEILRPALLGLAAGTMTVASISGLLLPGFDQGSDVAVTGGVIAGVLFLLIARQRLERRSTFGEQQWASERGRASLLVFVVLFVHSLPEGLAIGTAYASDTAGLSLFVILAIAVQNIPEGTSIAIPMAAAGFSRTRQFWTAVATSAPQPVGAVVAYLLVKHVEGLLPLSFGFAAGAMLALVVVELLPNALRGNWRAASAGAALGAAAMLGLSTALGV
jgi:zinc transporter, ZIP family